jgi:hypothetical protein
MNMSFYLGLADIHLYYQAQSTDEISSIKAVSDLSKAKATLKRQSRPEAISQHQRVSCVNI